MNTNKALKLYPCGLGTFLSIANETIVEKLRNGEYTSTHAQVLHSNAITALYHLGGTAELLGMERIDFVDDMPHYQTHAAWTLFGRAIQELAYTIDRVTPYTRHYTPNATASSETFPPENVC
ncbi:hypothetical protein ACKLNO_00575 [Neisseriaceae bacterium B1]